MPVCPPVCYDHLGLRSDAHDPVTPGCQPEAHLTTRSASSDNPTKGVPLSTQEQRRDPYQAVTDLILEHLERGTVPWRCPWQREVGIPRNFHSGKTYNGINVLLLGIRHRPSPWWLTYRQALERGGHVRKGEKGAFVVKYGQIKPKNPTAGSAPSGIGSQDNDSRRSRMFLREYTVFNASQIDGIEFPAQPVPQKLQPSHRIEAAERLVQAMPTSPVIKEGATTQACYRPSTDMVFMPALESFECAESFYLTLYHELTHATGHPSRLNRESLIKHDGFGGKVYSQEELVAEMGSAFLGMEVDIIRDQHEQSAAYLQSWLEVLRAKEHKRWIINAAAQATKAVDFILDRHLVPKVQPEEATITA